jgi:plastocyanin
MMQGRAVLACAAALLAALAHGAMASQAVPDRVQVTGSEYDLLLSEAKVAPGRVIVQFLNDGEDPHDLKLQRLGAGGQEGPELALGEVEPGSYANLDTHLRKGTRYVLWCSLTGHRQLGMEATLKVARHRP